MKLTKREANKVLKAVDLILEQECFYACAALSRFDDLDRSPLVRKFADFYEQDPGEVWNWYLYDTEICLLYKDIAHRRAMALLFFYEVCK